MPAKRATPAKQQQSTPAAPLAAPVPFNQALLDPQLWRNRPKAQIHAVAHPIPPPSALALMQRRLLEQVHPPPPAKCLRALHRLLAKPMTLLLFRSRYQHWRLAWGETACISALLYITSPSSGVPGNLQ